MWDGSYPSVTSVLGILDKPALMQWAANGVHDYYVDHLEELRASATTDARVSMIVKGGKTAYRKASKAALNIGTSVHEAIQAHLSGSAPEPHLVNDAATNSFLAFLEWEKSVRLEPVAIERVVLNRKLGYAGTTDLVAHIDHEGSRLLCVFDWKSSKAIYREYVWQSFAYAEAWNLENEPKAVAAGVIRLDKETGEPDPVILTDMKEWVKSIQLMEALSKAFVLMWEGTA
jgi:hypothetical protein